MTAVATIRHSGGQPHGGLSPGPQQAAASAQLWGRPQREPKGSYGAAEASGAASASPSRAVRTPGLRREGAGGARPRGVVMATGWGARGAGAWKGRAAWSRWAAGGGGNSGLRTREQRCSPAFGTETWCGVGDQEMVSERSDTPMGGIAVIERHSIESLLKKKRKERLDLGRHELIAGFHNLSTLPNRFHCLKDDSPRAP